ncbi:uncharacterized protein LOC143183134 [Calliopsis andreniformis]|uniref:uncharacterized protein LOC143183134 n=1 Tax=Calliopsis andreniformis TaxID=337506 RepID=UPI003FCDA7D9
MSGSRGRGWAQNDKNPLPRPGRPLCPENIDSTKLINIINAVNKNLEEKVEEAVKYISEKENDESLKSINGKLYEHAMSNRQFGPKLIMLYRNPKFKEDSKGSIMWKHLVYSLQTDYERKEQLREENVAYFHNVVCLFSEFLLQSQSTLSVLYLALLEYMELLLKTATTDDIKIFTEQVITHRSYLLDNLRKELDELMIVVRQTLVKENISLASRQMLLYIIDLINHNCDPLPQNLQEFYEQQLGKHFVQRINNNNHK